MKIKITDAPADNKEVEAVFVTVTNIKVDGESVSAFEGPKTINVMALQNGKTELLVKEDFRAKTYNSITLELDFDRDEDGNSPGTYVKTANGTKQKLSAEGKAAMAYTFNGTTKVMENSESTVVIDFDLRKFVRSESGSSSSYGIASSSELNGYLRFADADYSGSLRGTFDGEIDSDEEVVVYVYKKGEFNANSEMDDSNGVQFKNAVASAMVTKGITGNTYKVHFLDEGRYEVHFVSYEENSTSGELVLQGELEVAGETETNLSEIEIKAGIEATVNVMAKEVIG